MNKNKLKIQFISLPFVDINNIEALDYLYNSKSVTNLPYGLLSICSYLQHYSEKELEFDILNINDELVLEHIAGNVLSSPYQYFIDYLIKNIKEFQADIVCLSVLFNINYEYYHAALDVIKSVNPNALTIVGGNLASVISNEIVDNSDIDAVCFGEGEIPLLALINSDNFFECLNSHDAFLTKNKLVEGFTPRNFFVTDLDQIPPIDFSFTNTNIYTESKLPTLFEYNKRSNKSISRILYTSRGCPFNCSFCSCTVVHGRKVRYYSIERVISDVRRMIDCDGVNELFVCDDGFLVDKVRAKSLMKEFIKLNIKVLFPSLLMRNIDEEVASLLFKLGNETVFTSFESGSEYVRQKIINKPVTKAQAKKAVEALRKNGIKVFTNIITGFPGENDCHRKETLQTLEEIGFNWVYFLIAFPLPGSRLYNECKEKNYIVNEKLYITSLRKCNIKTPDYSPEHIEHQNYMMNLYTNFLHNYELKTGMYESCINRFSAILKSHPSHAFALYALMKTYICMKNYDKAYDALLAIKRICNSEVYWQDWLNYFEIDLRKEEDELNRIKA